MKVAIDVSTIVYGTGVSVYTRELVNNLLQIDATNEYVLFGMSLRRQEELRNYFKLFKEGNFKTKVLPIPPTLADIIWNKIHKFQIEKFVGKTDVFHSSDWTQPPSKAFRVTTIHDLVPVLFPLLSHPKIVSAHRKRLDIVRREVDRIIVPSHATRDDLVKLNFKEEKIIVIPEAATPGIRKTSSEEVDLVKKKYKIGGEYILSVGVNPRKNTERIIRAFEAIRPGKDIKLVLIGNPYSIKVDETRGVRLLGHVTDSELSALYTGATVFLYPSLYEGFGIPILDSFVCGTPVVTSDLGSMVEVAGDAAVLVDPEDVDSIVEGIKLALRDRNLLIKRGRERVKQFSWKKMADETLKVYSDAH